MVAPDNPRQILPAYGSNPFQDFLLLGAFVTEAWRAGWMSQETGECNGGRDDPEGFCC